MLDAYKMWIRHKDVCRNIWGTFLKFFFKKFLSARERDLLIQDKGDDDADSDKVPDELLLQLGKWLHSLCDRLELSFNTDEWWLVRTLNCQFCYFSMVRRVQMNWWSLLRSCFLGKHPKSLVLSLKSKDPWDSTNDHAVVCVASLDQVQC